MKGETKTFLKVNCLSRGNIRKVKNIYHFNNNVWHNSLFLWPIRLWNKLQDKVVP